MSGQDFEQMNLDAASALKKLGLAAVLVCEPERTMRETSWSPDQVTQLRRTLERGIETIGAHIPPCHGDNRVFPSPTPIPTDFIPPWPPDESITTYLLRIDHSFGELERVARLGQDSENAEWSASLDEDQIEEIRCIVRQGTVDIKRLLDQGVIAKSGQETK